MATSNGVSERDVKRECVKVFQAAGWMCWRIMAGKFKAMHGGWVDAGMNSNYPDLGALIPNSGARLLFCESKRQGKPSVRPGRKRCKDGSISEEQQRILEQAAREGAFCCVIADPDVLRNIVRALTLNPYEKADNIDENGNARFPFQGNGQEIHPTGQGGLPRYR